MNTQETTTGNRLIAEFVQENKHGAYSDTGDFILAKYCNDQSAEGKFYKWEDMRFHSSWSWLMPVVEKVEGLSHKGFSILVNIGSDGAYIGINGTNAGADKYEGKKEIANTLNANYFNDYPGAERVSKIQSVWQAVVQFIQWYNQNKTI